MEKKELIQSIKASNRSFFELLKNFEMDGYIKNLHKASANNDSLSVQIMTELAAYVAGKYLFEINAVDAEAGQAYVDTVLETMEGLISIPMFEDYVRIFYNNADENTLQGRKVLDDFDNMTAMFDGAFYKNMGVDNPGAVRKLYDTLLEAYEKLSKAA
jgi:hypothetical protein